MRLHFPCAPRPEVIATLNREIDALLAGATIKSRLADWSKLIADETEKPGKVIRAAGIKAE